MLTVPQDKRYEIHSKTTFEEFMSVMDTDRRTSQIDRDILQLIFSRVRSSLPFLLSFFALLSYYFPFSTH